MNTRELTNKESEAIEVFDRLGIKYELIFLTETGLSKSILDATLPIVNLLRAERIHDYELQAKGPEYKVILPCVLLCGSRLEETKVSFYRPKTKDGDPRFWPGRLSSYVSADQVLALLVISRNLVFFNLSVDEPFGLNGETRFSELLDSLGEEEANIDGADATIIEDATSSEIDEPSRFEVSSYGWDSDVEGLVKRLNRGDIKLPGFQRGFVWSKTEQSRFIESLILGLPVPNIFLAQDKNSKILNIIDGQQRLKTLQNYMSGGFPISNSKKIHEDLRGRYFDSAVAKTSRSKVLDEADSRTLSDSILHSIVIRPDPSSDSPAYGYEYNNAVIQIFRRLNTSGKPLQPQEVRSCIFYGTFDNLLHELNSHESWRSLFGPEHSRYKDVETILRFFALLENGQNYKATMPSFLDKFMEDNRNIGLDEISKMREIFHKTTDRLYAVCGDSLFKVGGTFLLSKFDAVMIGFAKSIFKQLHLSDMEIEDRINRLLKNDEYIEATTDFINDTGNVKSRITKAVEIISG